MEVMKSASRRDEDDRQRDEEASHEPVDDVDGVLLGRPVRRAAVLMIVFSFIYFKINLYNIFIPHRER